MSLQTGEFHRCRQRQVRKVKRVTALEWLRLAAEQGDADAQFIMGIMYSKGLGVPQDWARAYMWFNLAAQLGDHDAAKNRDAMASCMIPTQIAAVQKLVRRWKPFTSPNLMVRPL